MITVGEQRLDSEQVVQSIVEKLPELQLVNEGEVTEGVYCWAYIIPNDTEKDLAIVLVNAGHSTPRQLIVSGKSTIEVYLAGSGKLMVEKNGSLMEFLCLHGRDLVVEVNVGDTIQWHADNDSDLIFYEVCYPPYKAGRYEDLEE